MLTGTKKILSCLLFFIFVFFNISIVFSQTSSVPVGTSTAQTPIVDEESKPLNMGIAFEYSQDVAQAEAGPRKPDQAIEFSPSYRINETLTAAGIFSLLQTSSEDKQVLASNTQLKMGIKGWDLSESLQSAHSITSVLPTSDVSKKRDRLISGLSLSNGLIYAIHPKLEARLTLGLTRNFHEFEINAEGSQNVEYRLSNAIDLKLSLTDKLSLTTKGVYRIGRTYTGFERYDFQFHADINFDVLTNLSMNVGTSNEGPALKANGVDSNISVFDEKSNVWRVGLSTEI